MSINTEKRKPTFKFAAFMMIAIVSLTTVGMVLFDASITVMFILSWLIVVPAAIKLGYTNSEIERSTLR